MTDFHTLETAHSAALSILHQILSQSEHLLFENRVNKQIVPSLAGWIRREVEDVLGDLEMGCDLVGLPNINNTINNNYNNINGNNNNNINGKDCLDENGNGWEMDLEPECILVDSWAVGIFSGAGEASSRSQDYSILPFPYI